MIGSQLGRRQLRPRACIRPERGIALAMAAVGLLYASTVQAQLKQPGQHIRYGVEVEPQVSLQWAHLPGDSAGIGPGLRLSVPIISDGPLKKLNNSLAIGLGFNWAYFQEPCGAYFWEGSSLTPEDPEYATYSERCTAHHFTAPIVIQWNFFVTKVVSLFAEPGMAFVYERRSGTGWCDNGPCSKSDSVTKLPFVMWGGARMAMSDSLALTIRLGTPYVSAGASLFF